MSHWGDLMELDAGSEVTPSSIVTERSQSLETTPLESISDVGDLAMEDTNIEPDTVYIRPEKSPEPDVEADEDNDESGGEQSQTDQPRKRPLSERKKAQRMVFSSWVAQRGEKVTKERVQEIVENTEDKYLSIRSLMRKQESKVIIGDPREYQMELFERAKQQNVIAVLDTGSGKTLIAVLLLRHVIDEELRMRKELPHYKPKISFFLVDSVTLVFQQHAVLDCNLDQNIERFCGEMGVDLWSKSLWQKQFKENMVIVCTAEILYQCLMHSFISMNQINLLIFDEAHHAKKNHVYARIIKDYYMQEANPQKRPKVFGMTASPVDAKQDVVEAARELELMLDCQIATAADLSLLRMSISRPNESIAKYERLQPPYLTPLCERLKATFGDLEPVRKVLAFAQEATSELGEWCADHVWHLSLKDEEARKIERKTERLHNAAREARSTSELDAELEQIRKAQEIVNQWTFRKVTDEFYNNISPKVLVLKQYLETHFKQSASSRCIIFVRRRYTARLLMEIFSQFRITNAKLGVLIGTRYGDAGDVKISFRQQIITLRDFKEGNINCLFATSIAEEGLDIPDCNVVVRFDLYSTMIQYIQSRGRARHAQSEYIHFMEAGNKVQVEALRDVRKGEEKMREFCKKLPADRLLEGNDSNFESALAKEKHMRRYTEPETGATLTYASSLVVLAHYVSCLAYWKAPTDDDTDEKTQATAATKEGPVDVTTPATRSNKGHGFKPLEAVLQPTYIMTMESKRFVCEVILPEGAPIRSAVGRPCSRKAIAKRSAAFEMCIKLRAANHLDSNLISTIHKYLPAKANQRYPLLKKSTEYGVKFKPRLWKDSRGTVPTMVYLTVFQLAEPENLTRPSQPLALVTRTPLPDLPPIPLHLPSRKTSNALSTSIIACLNVTESDIAKLTDFTLCVWKDVYGKTFEYNVPEMSYWFAPILKDARAEKGLPTPEPLVDWKIMNDVHNSRTPIRWTSEMPHRQLEERLLVHPTTGSRNYFSVKVEPALRPHDVVPQGADQGANPPKTILEYTFRPKSKKRSAKLRMTSDQPVLEARFITLRRNWLDDLNDSESQLEETVCYICPEPFIISNLPIPVVSMAYLLTAIVHRVESHLITLEACQLLDLAIKPHLALEALTKDTDHTEEHRGEQIHVERGMGKNYERLEFIGDCFLKMATTISIFCTRPDHDEFDYHVTRMEMICNKNLLETAQELGLPEYIRSSGFNRERWYPQGIKMLAGKGYNKTDAQRWTIQHHLGDKTVADVCEALIGAALLSYNDTRDMDMAVKAVTKMVSSEYHTVTEWSQYWGLYKEPAWQSATATASQLDLAAQMERKHNYRFQHPRLLRSAFMHPSYPFLYEKVPSYQRLEFLGDALLDMTSIFFLFFRHPDRDPQWLTEHKMAMVSNRFLAALAVELGFHKHLRCAGALVEASVRTFVDEIAQLKLKADGRRDYWTAAENPPKCLSDIVESYIGAIFVDSKFDFGEVERFFEEHIRYFFEDMRIYDTFANNHPMTHLQNHLVLDFNCINHTVMADELPSIDGSPPRNVAAVIIHNKVIAEGSASSSKNAKVKAALRANAMLDDMDKEQYQRDYCCDCETGKTKQQNGDTGCLPDQSAAENALGDFGTAA